jgi:hypothetical protein
MFGLLSMTNPNIFPNICGARFGPAGRSMSCSVAKGGWEVRWRDSDGRQRSRRFKTEEAAREFDEALHEHVAA